MLPSFLEWDGQQLTCWRTEHANLIAIDIVEISAIDTAHLAGMRLSIGWRALTRLLGGQPVVCVSLHVAQKSSPLHFGQGIGILVVALLPSAIVSIASQKC